MNTDQLKQWRSDKKMTQPEMAKFIGVPFSTYRNWETGIRKPGKTGIRLLEIVRRADVLRLNLLD